MGPSCNDTWYFLAYGSGTPVRCAGNITNEQINYGVRDYFREKDGPEWIGPGIECASRTDDGLECQWGRIYERPEPFQPLHGIHTADPPYIVPCPWWRDDEGRDPCEVLGCHRSDAHFCWPPRDMPTLDVRPGWLFTVISNENGRVDFSSNTFHAHIIFAGMLAVVVGLSLLFLCGCAVWACVMRRKLMSALRKVTISKTRLAYQVNLLRAKSLRRKSRRKGGPELLLSSGKCGCQAMDASAETTPLSDPTELAPLPAWDVMYVEEEDEGEEDEEGEEEDWRLV